MSESKHDGSTCEDVQLETVPVAVSQSDSREESPQLSLRTYVVLFCLGITWGTCTMANVGPSTTYSYAVDQLGGTSLQTWIPNAALFPLIGLQPIWVH